MLLLLATLVVTNGCGNKAMNNNSNNLQPYVSDGSHDTTFTINNAGATVDLTLVSVETLEAFWGRGLGDVKNVKLNVNLRNLEAAGSNIGTFGGKIQISFDEIATDVNGNATGTIGHGGNFDAGQTIYDAQFNKWYAGDFKSFSQDSLGAVIVTIDQETNDLNVWGGHVYFKNFNFNICSSHWPYYCAPQPMRTDGSLVKCWFIGGGSPYDCRSYLSNNSVRPDLVATPNNGYTLIGAFSNIDIKKALGIN